MLKGTITIPADKSISHRSLIFGALTNNKIEIKNLSLGADCLSTVQILKNLGVEFKFLSKKHLILDSSKGLSCNKKIELDCGNSGTTARLLSGVFASSNLQVVLVGDKSLSKRPMARVIEPLKLMGAKINSNDNKLPLEITGADLKGITYNSPIASAQVKSCLLLAGLGASGETRVIEPVLSRNHSEILLKYLEADIETKKTQNGFLSAIKSSKLTPKPIEIPGDISSAAFFLVAAAIIPNSSILVKNVGINPTRDGIIEIFSNAGIDYKIHNQRLVSNEPVADIEVNYSDNIKPFVIKGDIIPRLIDEIPILAVLMTQANGISRVQDAQDLRNKESDRIKTIVETFKQLGVNIEEKKDGFIIEGKKDFNCSITAKTHLDHRLAMSYYILSLINKKPMEIEGFDCINTSFPEFLELINQLN